MFWRSLAGNPNWLGLGGPTLDFPKYQTRSDSPWGGRAKIHQNQSKTGGGKHWKKQECPEAVEQHGAVSEDEWTNHLQNLGGA
jgi:hypothetical protein